MRATKRAFPCLGRRNRCLLLELGVVECLHDSSCGSQHAGIVGLAESYARVRGIHALTASPCTVPEFTLDL